MRNTVVILFLIIGIFVTWLYGAIGDSGAMRKAKDLWGDQAMIGTARKSGDSNWTKIVGFSSPQCTNDFTVVGKGFNTWDSAFADADTHPAMVGGPFRSAVTIRGVAGDNIAVASVQFFVDGNKVGSFSPTIPGPTVPVSLDLNMAPLSAGFHVLCLQAMDTSANVGRSANGYLFRVDPSAPATNTEWVLPQFRTMR